MDATRNPHSRSRWDLIEAINSTPRPQYKNRLEQIKAANEKYGYLIIKDMKAVLK